MGTELHATFEKRSRETRRYCLGSLSRLSKNVYTWASSLAILPLFYEKSATLAMIKHGMGVVKQATNLLNPGSVLFNWKALLKQPMTII